jgi:nucleoid DNA-binding protein
MAAKKNAVYAMIVPAKKVAANNAPAKNAAAKKAAPVKATPVKLGAVSTPFAKSALLQHIATNTGLARKQVAHVLEEITSVVAAHVHKKSKGQFVLPGLFKITVVRKPAQKGGKKVIMMGKEVITKSKPARNVVRIRPLKKLKDFAA